METDHQMIDTEPTQNQVYRQIDYLPLPDRQSIMTINRPNLFNSIKEKCLTRLSEQRRSLISKYRSETLQQLTESKRKSNYIVRQAHNEILQDNVINGIIHDEINGLPELTIDEWNQQYHEIFSELNEYLARQLLESTTNDELYHFEKYQQMNIQETDQIAQIYDPNNNTFYICALCKRYVYKMHQTKICCEKPGCIDVDLKFEDFRLEDVMNMIMRVLIDHKQSCEDQGRECCAEDKYIKVKIASLSEVGMSDEPDDTGNDSLALFVTCDHCAFLDFISLF